jgi:hypothetical protein
LKRAASGRVGRGCGIFGRSGLTHKSRCL